MSKSCQLAAAAGLFFIVGAAQAQTQYTWQALEVGDRGVPGDGITTTARYDGEKQKLAPLFPMHGVANGLTITVFPDAASPTIDPDAQGFWDGIEYNFETSDHLCYVGTAQPWGG